MNRIILFTLFVLSAITVNAQHYRDKFSVDHTKFRIGLQAGWSKRIAPISASVPFGLRDYARELKEGYSYGASGTFFFNRTFGMGLLYSTHRANNSTALWNGWMNVNISDDITIDFIGLLFNTRFIFGENEHLQLLASVAPGYITYKDNAMVNATFQLEGRTLGINLALGLDIALFRNVFLGVEASAMAGSLSSYDYSAAPTFKKIELTERESLTRVDLSGGIRFNF